MKIWIRLLLGVVVGLAVGIFLPLLGGDTEALLSRIADLGIRIAVYALFPVVFFGMIIAADELREDGTFIRVFGVAGFWVPVITLVAIVIGMVAVLGLEPQRIPPILQESQTLSRPDLIGAIGNIFNRNLFEGLVSGPFVIVPVAIAGLIIGLTLQFDREITEPFRMVADSANRIFYRINTIFVDLLALPILVATTVLILELRGSVDILLFGQLLLVVGVTVVVLGFVVLPLLLRTLGGVRSPLRWLHAMMGPILAAASTGDAYFSLIVGLHIGKEDLGISRRSGAVIFPLAAAFLKPGTALVSASGFLLVIRSYTALDIGFSSLLIVAVTAWLFSFLLAQVPAGGVLLLLSILSLRYGQGMEESYLILLPVIPLLQRIAVVLDTIAVGFIATFVSERTGHRKQVDPKMMV